MVHLEDDLLGRVSPGSIMSLPPHGMKTHLLDLDLLFSCVALPLFSHRLTIQLIWTIPIAHVALLDIKEATLSQAGKAVCVYKVEESSHTCANFLSVL